MQDIYVLQLKVYDWSKLGTCLCNENWICCLRICLKIFGERLHKKKCVVSLQMESLRLFCRRGGVLNTTFYLGIAASSAEKVRGHKKDRLEEESEVGVG
jgi:hypothetical protein